ncbi:hypothetical protein V8C35DRAFT_330257 [Trichoderma chlorosporum]
MALRRLAAAGVLLSPLAAASASTKRGLVFTPNSATPQDNSIWVQSGSDLTWYYNYGNLPSSDYVNIPQSKFEFVPMMWGVGPNPSQDFAFYDSVVNLIETGTPISHVLAYNEPDGPTSQGGSDVTPQNAALSWIAEFVPLQQKYNVRIGAPAVTGSPSGFTWLEQFFGNCTDILGSECPFDFIPLHWYDNLAGLESHVNQYATAYPGKKLWVTEYALPNQALDVTQQFFNQSASYLDGFATIERYSYFGAFRSDTSNVGPNAVFLDNAGHLTDIGSEYLGFGPTGIIPTSNA